MLPFMLIALAGAGLFALASIFDDDADSDADEDSVDRDAPDDAEDDAFAEWLGSDFRVTPEGGEPSFVSEDPGTDGNELIETNITDEVYQHVDAGDGLDVVRIGLGDSVDTLSLADDSETGDDIAGEDGDHVVVTILEEDLARAVQLETVYSEVHEEYFVETLLDLDMHVFNADMGSGDTLEIAMPDTAGGAIFTLQGHETYYSGPEAWGPEILYHYAYVFYSEDGTIPEGLSVAEDAVSYDDSNGPLGPDDLDGIYILGRINLGESYWAQDPQTLEVTSWDRSIEAATVTLTQPAAVA